MRQNHVASAGLGLANRRQLKSEREEKSMLPVRFALIGAIGACLLVGPVRAEIMTVDLHVSWKDAENRDAEWTIGETISQVGSFDSSGRFNTRAARNYESANTVWEMTIARGPTSQFISTAMVVTNNMATPQVFSFNLAAPSPMAIGSPTLVTTSMSLGVGDQNADGATLTNDLTTAIYTASINAGMIDTLGNGLTLTANPEQTNSTTEGNMFGGGPALGMGDMLGIDMQFVLSPGDTATFISTLAIAPEPAGLTLLLAGSALTLLRRRRSPQRA